MPTLDRPPDGDLLWVLKVTEGAATRSIDEVLRECGLTKSQFGVMRALVSLGPTSSARLAKAVSVSPQAMVGLVAALERKGYIRRQVSTESARILTVSATTAGMRAYDWAACRVGEIDRKLDAVLTATERTQVMSCLERIAGALRDGGSAARRE